jgi:hypothetical protein
VAACADVYVGQAAAGDICFVDSYCRDGMVCDFRGATGDAGKCHAPLALGEACAGTCGPGLFCDQSLHCAARLDAGAACTNAAQCASGYCAPETTPGAGRVCAAAPPLCAGA